MHFPSLSLFLLTGPLAALAAPASISTTLSTYTTPKSGTGYEVGTFYVNWAIYGRQHFVTDLPAAKLTRINYAFANINNLTGEVFLSDPWADLQYKYPSDTASNLTVNSNATILYGNFNQLFKLKQQHRNLKTVLSVGGWSYRENFKPALATEQGRVKFAESALALVKDLGLDGVDVDWEYPESGDDSDNLVDAVKRLREVSFVFLMCSFRSLNSRVPPLFNVASN